VIRVLLFPCPWGYRRLAAIMRGVLGLEKLVSVRRLLVEAQDNVRIERSTHRLEP
jgi:hypothetical protein